MNILYYPHVHEQIIGCLMLASSMSSRRPRTPSGIKYLTSNLPMQQLRLLDLSHNGLTDVSAENLAKALSRCRGCGMRGNVGADVGATEIWCEWCETG